jgi:hypothetical protein
MKITKTTERGETTISDEPTDERRRLIEVRDRLQTIVDRDNSGDWVWWWVAEDAFELPDHTLARLEEAGPAVTSFFRAAGRLFDRHAWVRERIEKRISPAYQRLNRARPGELPLLPRPDVVPDEEWNPVFVELEITVCARAETTAMAELYELPEEHRLVTHYARLFEERWPGKTLGLLAAPHPFWSDLPNDAAGLAAKLRRQGIDVVLLTGEELPLLRYDGKTLWLCSKTGPPRPIHVVDRFIDIYEIAELQHPGMQALLDAWVDGAIDAMNTFNQSLDEKEWLALFWDARLRDEWRDLLGDRHDALLREMIPRTYRLKADLQVDLPGGETLSVLRLGELPPQKRRFLVKESGTSPTSSGAQSVQPLDELSHEEATELLEELCEADTPWVLQQIVRSPEVEFTALNPETEEVVHQTGAHVKLSPFYVDGHLSDIKFIASNAQLAVNNKECVETVVRRRASEEEL